MLIAAASSLERLAVLTSPGAPVAPVVAELDSVASTLASARPVLEQAKASAWLLGEVDRVRAASAALRDALAELADRDGMETFDPAFAADDAGWDAWFAEGSELLRTAAKVAGQPTVAPTTSTASV